MSTIARLLVEPLLSWLLDTRCVACGARQADALCSTCRNTLAGDGGLACVRCDHPLPRADSPCPDCARLGRPAFEAVVAIGPYRGALKEAVLALKYRDGWRVADILAETLVPRLTVQVDAVVGVPIDRARRAARGYSQSELLASRLAVRLGVRHASTLLQRRVDGVVQSTAPLERRHAQVAGVFEALPASRDRRLLLVDDVMTTAATLHAAASALRARGARVWGAVAARQTLHGGRR